MSNKKILKFDPDKPRTGDVVINETFVGIPAKTPISVKYQQQKIDDGRTPGGAILETKQTLMYPEEACLLIPESQMQRIMEAAGCVLEDYGDQRPPDNNSGGSRGSKGSA